MGGKWRNWERASGCELDLGNALRGTVVQHSYPPHNGAWGASLNTTFIGFYAQIEDAKARVEKALHHDMKRVLEDWTTFLEGQSAKPEIDEMEMAVNAAIATCQGDMRATIRSLLIANGFLEEEHERLANSISNGFARGTHRKKKQQS